VVHNGDRDEPKPARSRYVRSLDNHGPWYHPPTKKPPPLPAPKVETDTKTKMRSIHTTRRDRYISRCSENDEINRKHVTRMLSIDGAIDATLEAGRRLDSWDNIVRELSLMKPDY